jgi:hypothetical protein
MLETCWSRRTRRSSSRSLNYRVVAMKATRQERVKLDSDKTVQGITVEIKVRPT